MEGKAVHSALRFLSEKQGGGVLELSDLIDDSRARTVLDVLGEKHPAGLVVDVETLVTTSENPPEHIRCFSNDWLGR